MIAYNYEGGYNDPLQDYRQARQTAVKWARHALQNKREGLPWQQCAKNAHEALKWAFSIPGFQP